jgi:predicted tellurium resistance membrane protein TerC
MTNYGKYNLYAMLGMPIIAALASIIVFGDDLLPSTIPFVFGTNLAPMLIGGLVSALLLRFATKPGGRGKFIAIWPTLVPAAVAALWYIGGAIIPNNTDAGREYFALPIYLVMGVVAMSIIALIGCLVVRSSDSPAPA